MSASLPQVPCLGTSKSYYEKKVEKNPSSLTVQGRVALIALGVILASGAALLVAPLLPPIGQICLLGTIVFSMGALGTFYSTLFPSDSVLKNLARLEPAKRLAAKIDLSSAVQQELIEVIP